MAFNKASLFIFFLIALVLCQQSIALGSSAKDTQTSVDNLHVEQHEQRRVMEEGPGKGSSSDDSPVLTSDGASSDSTILMMIGLFFAIGGLLHAGGYYFICVMIVIGVLFIGFLAAKV